MLPLFSSNNYPLSVILPCHIVSELSSVVLALQAAAFMRATIQDAYQKWTTGFYDYIQAVQNNYAY
jgi:hypothetical protein